MRWRRRRSRQRTLWPAGQAPPERQRRPRTPRPLCLGVSTRRRRSTLSTTLSVPRCRLTRRDGTRSPLRPTRSGRRWSTRATEPGSWSRRTETSWRRRQRVKRCGHSAGKVEGGGGGGGGAPNAECPRQPPPLADACTPFPNPSPLAAALPTPPSQELRRVEGLLRDMSDTTLRLVASHKEQDAQIAVAHRERDTLQSEADATRRRLARALDQASRSALALMRGESSEATMASTGCVAPTTFPAPVRKAADFTCSTAPPASATLPGGKGPAAGAVAPRLTYRCASHVSQPASAHRPRRWCLPAPCCPWRAVWSRAGTRSAHLCGRAQVCVRGRIGADAGPRACGQC